MEMNQYSGDGHGLPYAGLPFGLQTVAANSALNGYSYENLTEAEKEHLLMQCKDAKSMGEKQRIVANAMPDTDLKAIAEEEAVSNSYKRSPK